MLTVRMKAQMSWMDVGMRHAEWSSRVLGGVIDDGGKEKADGDGPLVARDDGATDPLGRALGLVHGDEGGDEADAGAREEAADDEGGPVVGAGLEGDAEGKDDAGDDDAHAAAEDVGERGGK